MGDSFIKATKAEVEKFIQKMNDKRGSMHKNDALRYSGYIQDTEEPSRSLSETLEDLINKPKHYNQGKYQPINVIEDWRLNYHLGNLLKYVSRAKHKGNEVQDLKKGLWYLQRYIEILENEESP